MERVDRDPKTVRTELADILQHLDAEQRDYLWEVLDGGGIDLVIEVLADLNQEA